MHTNVPMLSQLLGSCCTGWSKQAAPLCKPRTLFPLRGGRAEEKPQPSGRNLSQPVVVVPPSKSKKELNLWSTDLRNTNNGNVKRSFFFFFTKIGGNHL